ncbi:MAG: ParB/RepB/Spo0J family partition protein [Bacteroidia bacterium]|nr:ParB/RepB/Spo0J family partition protein [Bacteroidia bacterium]
MSKVKKGGLGRGLSALLQNADTDITITGEYKPAGTVSQILVNQIEANPFQPRTEFEKKALDELADSIRVHGLIQPVTVRKMGYDKYQLISGERRTRASILAGLDRIPAYIRIANDQEMLEMALIENIQRENLNAIEVALSYKRLLDECSLKQEELGERVGKERSTVTNYLRLLSLPGEVQVAIKEDKISMGHAKAIAGIDNEEDQVTLLHRIFEENLSVRSVEEIVKEAKKSKRNPDTSKPEKITTKKPEHAWMTEQNTLAEKFNTSVRIKGKDEKGEIVIPFTDRADLERLLELL